MPRVSRDGFAMFSTGSIRSAEGRWLKAEELTINRLIPLLYWKLRDGATYQYHWSLPVVSSMP